MLWFSNLSIMSEWFECFEALTETARWPGSRAAWWASLTWKGWRSWWWPTLRRRRPFQLSGQMTPWQRWLLQSACGRPHSAGIINIVCLVIFRCDTWPRVEGVTCENFIVDILMAGYHWLSGKDVMPEVKAEFEWFYRIRNSWGKAD